MVDLSALAYATRQALVAKGIPISLSHAQQFVAAALGHGTLAAYQASGDAQALAGAAHVVVDGALLQERAENLGRPGDAVLAAVVEVLGAMLPGRVHKHDDAYLDWLREFVDSATYKSEGVGGQMAMTNNDGLGEIYMPFEHDDLEASDDGFSGEISGHVSMELDNERPYVGHRIDVEATLSADLQGKRMFSEPRLEVSSARLRWGDEDDPGAELQELDAEGQGQ